MPKDRYEQVFANARGPYKYWIMNVHRSCDLSTFYSTATGTVYPVVMWPVRKADTSSYVVKVKMSWSLLLGAT